MIAIRDALPDERPAIRELTLRAYAQYERIMTPTSWAGLDEAVRAALVTEEPVDWIVAEEGGKLLGSVMLWPPATDAYRGSTGPAGWPELRLLAVSEDARGRGVGQALVEECIRRARASGATHLGLHTARSMEAAVRMYERMGFVRHPASDFQPEGSELVRGYRLELQGTGNREQGTGRGGHHPGGW